MVRGHSTAAVRDDGSLLLSCRCRSSIAAKVYSYPHPRFGVLVENCVAGGDTRRISAASLHSS